MGWAGLHLAAGTAAAVAAVGGYGGCRARVACWHTNDCAADCLWWGSLQTCWNALGLQLHTEVKKVLSQCGKVHGAHAGCCVGINQQRTPPLLFLYLVVRRCFRAAAPAAVGASGAQSAQKV